jgi:hypothetical protein
MTGGVQRSSNSSDKAMHATCETYARDGWR